MAWLRRPRMLIALQERRRRNMAGRRGQIRALILGHRLSRAEVEAIACAEHFRVTIIHGWSDRRAEQISRDTLRGRPGLSVESRLTAKRAPSLPASLAALSAAAACALQLLRVA